MEGEKQGRLGNLEKMTVQQLQELLERQERLLSKQGFLRTLPDGGEKVKTFAARLQQMIAQRQGACCLTQTQPQPPALPNQQPSMENRPAASCLVKNSRSAADRDSAVESEGALAGHGEVMDGTAELSNAIDSLVISELTAPRMTERRGDLPTEGGSLEIRFPNSYENVMKKSHTAGKKRTPFKPNRSLKISDLNQLPDEFKHKSRSSASGASGSQPARQPASQPEDSPAQGGEKTSVKPLRDSAVAGPEYKFKGAKEISLQESFVLQRQQQENLEKVQAVHAAERLAERLNIKTADYHPPGLDMQYRSNAEDVDGYTHDSDDSPNEDDDVPD